MLELIGLEATSPSTVDHHLRISLVCEEKLESGFSDSTWMLIIKDKKSL